MKSKIGMYVGTGARFELTLGEPVKPLAMFIKGENSQPLLQWAPTSWVNRSVGLGPVESVKDGLLPLRSGSVLIGPNAACNTSGVRYYYLAIYDDGAGDVEAQGYMGNGASSRIVDFTAQKQIAAAIIKRDATRSGVAIVQGKKAAYLSGTTPSDCVTLGVGAMTVTEDPTVNEYDSAAGIGEGLSAIAFYAGSNDVQTVSWSGSPAAGTIIPVAGDPVAAFVFSSSGALVEGRFLTRDMPAESNSVCKVTAEAMLQNEAALVQGGIRLGSSTALRVGGGFSAIVLCRKESAIARPPAIAIKGRKGVYLAGRGTTTNIQCGASDATLKIDGAITIEWFGVLMTAPGFDPSADATLLTRGVGPANTAGAYSWGLGVQHRSDHGWSGSVSAIVSGRYAPAQPLDLAVWRSGLVIDYNRPVHYMLTHDGVGGWRLYRNGRLSRQRRQSIGSNVLSGSGHVTAFGGRPNSGGFTNHQRMIVLGGSVYARQLSHDEVVARYEREALGSRDAADVTAGLAERWDFSSASGVIVPATVHAGNNGTISNGRIITL